ncbi:MAG TPA: inositol monophosphatase family protein [Candidatus Dormibacteraeota bacterium]|jgi:histidinol-phosphatase|nr:inositol monophosphatase family protein [Candidatus Dormibacteraeota bacterium]
MDSELALALELADLADAVTMPRFRAADLLVESKADLTPVSEADRAAETAIRERIAAARPAHAVLGEEYGEGDPRRGPSGPAGAAPAGAAPRWIVDPIDGTRNYVRGIPVWATLIALEEDGDVRCGVVSAPALGRRWWAARGEGAWAAGIATSAGRQVAAGGGATGWRDAAGWDDARPIRVSAISRLEDAQVFHTGFDRMSPRDLTAFLALAGTCARARGFGDFWSHVLVAEGAGEIGLEANGVSVWDLAAVSVVVEEAGGRFTDHRGERTVRGGTAVSSNGLLHDQVLSILAGAPAAAAR